MCTVEIDYIGVIQIKGEGDKCTVQIDSMGIVQN